MMYFILRALKCEFYTCPPLQNQMQLFVPFIVTLTLDLQSFKMLAKQVSLLNVLTLLKGDLHLNASTQKCATMRKLFFVFYAALDVF